MEAALPFILFIAWVLQLLLLAAIRIAVSRCIKQRYFTSSDRSWKYISLDLIVVCDSLSRHENNGCGHFCVKIPCSSLYLNPPLRSLCITQSGYICHANSRLDLCFFFASRVHFFCVPANAFHKHKREKKITQRFRWHTFSVCRFHFHIVYINTRLNLQHTRYSHMMYHDSLIYDVYASTVKKWKKKGRVNYCSSTHWAINHFPKRIQFTLTHFHFPC